MIGICSNFFLETPTKTYKNHLEDLQSLELSRNAKNIFIHIQHHLKKNHPWDTLTQEPINIFPLDELKIHYGSLMQNTYKVGYKVWVKKEKKGEDHSIYRLLQCSIYFILNSDFVSWEKNLSKKKQPLHFSYNIFTSFSPETQAKL